MYATLAKSDSTISLMKYRPLCLARACQSMGGSDVAGRPWYHMLSQSGTLIPATRARRGRNPVYVMQMRALKVE